MDTFRKSLLYELTEFFFLFLFSFVKSNINVLYSGASFISIQIQKKINIFNSSFFFNSLTLPINTRSYFMIFHLLNLNTICLFIYYKVNYFPMVKVGSSSARNDEIKLNNLRPFKRHYYKC